MRTAVAIVSIATLLWATPSLCAPQTEPPTEKSPTQNGEPNPIKCHSEKNSEGRYVIVCTGFCSVPTTAPEGSVGYNFWHRVCDNQKQSNSVAYFDPRVA